MRKCYIILTENCFSGQNLKNSTGFSVTVKFDEFVFIYSMKFHVKNVVTMFLSIAKELKVRIFLYLMI